MKEKILKLREEGLSYNEIVARLGCSKGTVAYHCGDGQKEKTRNRTRTLRKNNPLMKKVEQFVAAKDSSGTKHKPHFKTVEQRIYQKIYTFSNKTGSGIMFTVQDLMDKIGDAPKCELTGKPIDLSKTRSYHLDHKIPKSRGGDNSLENCQLLSREANQAKHNLTNEEFIALCKTVVEHSERKELP